MEEEVYQFIINVKTKRIYDAMETAFDMEKKTSQKNGIDIIPMGKVQICKK